MTDAIANLLPCTLMPSELERIALMQLINEIIYNMTTNVLKNLLRDIEEPSLACLQRIKDLLKGMNIPVNLSDGLSFFILGNTEVSWCLDQLNNRMLFLSLLD